MVEGSIGQGDGCDLVFEPVNPVVVGLNAWPGRGRAASACPPMLQMGEHVGDDLLTRESGQIARPGDSVGVS